MNAVFGQPYSRIDGPQKVTGTATYAGEFAIPGLLHAALVLSTVPAGRIARVDAAAALQVPGVRAVISHENAPRLPYHTPMKRPQVDPQSGDQLQVFQHDLVHFNGQPIAVVVAETLEAAGHAASLVQVDYEQQGAHTVFDRAKGHPPSRANATGGRPGDTVRGDPAEAFAAAPVKVDATYIQPREHHNAIEPHVTIAHWEGEHLTLYDKTQWVLNDRSEIAHIFGIDQSRIRVISPFVGGAFGSALRTWPHVTIAALAAREVGAPVRLELTRRELYTAVGFRPHTEQRMRLAAEPDGRLTAIIAEAWGQTSTYEEYAEVTLDPPRSLYSCPNVHASYRLQRMHTNSPCPMRAPGTATGVLALEIAMDELADALGMDPVELRLRNYADMDEHKGLPYSSKELEACYRVGADRFRWHERDPRPGSMRDGRLQVGWGMATSVYPSHRSKAHVAVTLYANGSAVIRTASSDMGPGTYTAISQVVADRLGLPLDAVRFELGDTDYPQAPVHGGSITMASVGSAAQAACRALMEEIAGVLRGVPDHPLAGVNPAALEGRDGGIGLRGPGETVPYTELMRSLTLDRITAEGQAGPGEESKRFSSASFGAVFVEVQVDPDLGTIRVPRMVGAYDIGRVANPKTARSQCIGGLTMGLGMALLEEAEWDPRFGKVMNSNLAEYLVPVCADVQEIDVTFVPSEDFIFSPLGVKGVAEIAACGVSAAIVNAVYHATGRRLRDLPLTPDKLLG